MRLIAACLLGLMVYVALQAGILRKPLTVGYIRDAYALKTAYARTLGEQRKIVVIGGSGSLYGVRCQVLAARTGIPCVNMAVTAGIGLDVILAKAEPVVRSGDIILMPLEYDLLSGEETADHGNQFANTYVLTYDHDVFLGLTPRRRVEAVFSQTLLDALSSLSEMSLQALGVSRRFHLSDLTPEGDMSGHTVERAMQFTGTLARLNGAAPIRHGVPNNFDRKVAIDFVASMRAKQVTVMITYPATIDDAPFYPEDYAAWASFWRGIGADVLDLAGYGRYPRSWFYDTHYHLTEPAQISHSERLAASLADRLSE